MSILSRAKIPYEITNQFEEKEGFRKWNVLCIRKGNLIYMFILWK